MNIGSAHCFVSSSSYLLFRRLAATSRTSQITSSSRRSFRAAASSSSRSPQGGESDISSNERLVLQKLEEAESSLAKAKSVLGDLPKIDENQRRQQLVGKVMNAFLLAGFAGVLALGLGVFPLDGGGGGGGHISRQALAFALALGIGTRGYSKGSLSLSGCLAAVLVGWITFARSFAFGSVLLFFFFSGSYLTKLRQDEKEKVEKDFKKDGQRDWLQVLANGGIPTLVALLAPHFPNSVQMTGAFVGYYSCCCGDTWSSEIGVLSSKDPILITTLKPVRRGTNGGVSSLGLIASVAGGAGIGIVYFLASNLSKGLQLTAVTSPLVIPLCLAAGLLGSLIDSLLGATLQFSGIDEETMKISNKPGKGIVRISGLEFLNNDAVNVLSAMMTSIITSIAFMTLIH